MAALTVPPVKPVPPGAVNGLQAQAARLADHRFQTVQRQATASRLGRVGGNRYLQRLVALSVLARAANQLES